MRKASSSSAEAPRLFVGTVLGASIAEQVAQAAVGQLALPHWRAAPRVQWHVTSLFIGDRPAARIPLLLAAMAGVAARHAPFTLQHGCLAAMPAAKPTMLWVRFQPHPALEALHHDLATALHAATSQHRPHWPHITLARARTAPSPVAEQEVLPHLLLDRLGLYRSDPAPGGRVHVLLGEVPLGAR
jgi:2'-5' RNA ligase